MDKEIDISNFIEMIYSNNPQPPKSIFASFVDENSNDNLEGLFEILLVIFTDGMKKFYGKNENGILKVNLEQLTENDFNKINQYMNSFGIECKYLVESLNNLSNDVIISDKKNNLSDYFFKINCQNFSFTISFNYL